MKMKMSFRTYVSKHAERTDDAAGDFVKDAATDIKSEFSNFPTANNWKAVKRYLEDRGAIANAIDAGHKVWLRYRSQSHAAE